MSMSVINNGPRDISTAINDDHGKQVFSLYDDRRNTNNYNDRLAQSVVATEIAHTYAEEFRLEDNENKNYKHSFTVDPNFNCYITSACIELTLILNNDVNVGQEVPVQWQYFLLQNMDIKFNNRELINASGAGLISLIGMFNKDHIGPIGSTDTVSTKKINYGNILIPLPCNIFTKNPSYLSGEDKLTINLHFGGLDKLGNTALPASLYTIVAKIKIATTRTEENMLPSANLMYDRYHIIHEDRVNVKIKGSNNYDAALSLPSGGILNTCILDTYYPPEADQLLIPKYKNIDDVVKQIIVYVDNQQVAQEGGLASDDFIRDKREGNLFSFTKHDTQWNQRKGTGCFIGYTKAIKMRITRNENFAHFNNVVYMTILTVTDVYIIISHKSSVMVIDPDNM